VQFPDARILIFARAPVPGRVKTRLIPALGAEGACALYRDCLLHVVEVACVEALAPVELWCDPDVTHPVFAQLAARWPLSLRVQQGDDLGARMRHAVATALHGARKVVLIGSDVPALGPVHLQRALRDLEESEVVMNPAEDGGYVLLGVCADHPSLFEDMPWGSEQVAAETRRRCRVAGLRLREGEGLWDLDRPSDLPRLAAVPAMVAWTERVQHLPGECRLLARLTPGWGE